MSDATIRSRHRLFDIVGLSDDKLASIGAIAVLAAQVEHYTELAVWALEGGPKLGEPPSTDSMPMSALIARLEQLSERAATEQFAGFILAWCAAARPTFECRHSIVHGEAGLPYGGDWSLFTRNVSKNGVRRKRRPSEFHASHYTLALLEEAFEDCFTSIFIIWKTGRGLRPAAHFEKLLLALQRAQSTALELSDMASASHREKS